MPFAYHVDQFDASQERLCPSERFESQHRAYPPFDISVILLNQVVQVFTLPHRDRFLIRFVGVERGHSPGVGHTNYLRCAMVTYGLAEEAQCAGDIPFGGQQKVDCLTW